MHDPVLLGLTNSLSPLLRIQALACQVLKSPEKAQQLRQLMTDTLGKKWS